MSSTPEAIRTQILDLVRQYHTAKFASKVFDPDKDLVHYAGRVFDADEIVNLVDSSLDRKLAEEKHCPGNDQSRRLGLDCFTLSYKMEV
jgi:CDP-6-deoxy-D-xylo-4-hexulose-3-dehydrase